MTKCHQRRTPEYTNIYLTHERTKMGPEGAQGLGQKEREGPAGPENFGKM